MGLKGIDRSHTGQNMAQIVSSVIEEHGIKPKFRYGMMDNASNIDRGYAVGGIP